MILAADIGGTKTNVALFNTTPNRPLVPGSQRKYSSRENTSLESILQQYLAEAPAAVGLSGLKISAAGFGIAGVIKNGVCNATNLPWVVDSHKLAPLLGVAKVGMVNDLVAFALGITTLPADGFDTIQAGSPVEHGTKAVIAAGTGLGHACLIWDGVRYIPNPAELGHGDFAPRNDLQEGLRVYVTKNGSAHGHFGRCSYEEVLSGPGLGTIYDFLKSTGKYPEAPQLVAAIAAPHADKAAEISKASAAGVPVARAAIDMFVDIYAAQAGNYALATYATGGLYIGGNIAKNLLPMLKAPGFAAVFADKGPLKTFCQAIPIKFIQSTDAPLYGAAVAATMV
jgi:glucokinase